MRDLGSRKWIFVLISSLLVLGLSIAGFVLARESAPSEPQTIDLTYVPEYPGAQQVQSYTAEKDKEGFYKPNAPYKTVTFLTTDTPDRVFAFYKESLKQQQFPDWHLDSSIQLTNLLDVSGTIQAMRIGTPVYYFRVQTEQKNGLTHVTVQRSYQPGM
jgi:hypothetical protein